MKKNGIKGKIGFFQMNGQILTCIIYLYFYENDSFNTGFTQMTKSFPTTNHKSKNNGEEEEERQEVKKVLSICNCKEKEILTKFVDRDVS